MWYSAASVTLEFVEKVQKDADTLDEIFRNNKQPEPRNKEWEQKITYHAEVGIVFKESLSISPKGVAWKDKCYPLNSVTRIRWGGGRHSVNRIPTGSAYTLAFGDVYSEVAVKLRNQTTYTTFIDKIWHAVGMRLITELVETLKAGKEVQIGEATLRDGSVGLIKHNFLGSNELVWCPWSQINIWNSDGVFYIDAINDKKIYVGLSYINIPNVHFLEQIVRMALKKSGMTKLSDIFD